MMRERVGVAVDSALLIAGFDSVIASRLLRYDDLAREAEALRYLRECAGGGRDSGFPSRSRAGRAPETLKRVSRVLGAWTSRWSSRFSGARGGS